LLCHIASSTKACQSKLFSLEIVVLKDVPWVKQEVSKRCDFNEQLSKVKEKIIPKQFRDCLHGVFGSIDAGLFERHKNLLLKLGE
jgi:hypothetical protein